MLKKIINQSGKISLAILASTATVAIASATTTTTTTVKVVQNGNAHSKGTVTRVVTPNNSTVVVQQQPATQHVVKQVQPRPVVVQRPIIVQRPVVVNHPIVRTDKIFKIITSKYYLPDDYYSADQGFNPYLELGAGINFSGSHVNVRQQKADGSKEDAVDYTVNNPSFNFNVEFGGRSGPFTIGLVYSQREATNSYDFDEQAKYGDYSVPTVLHFKPNEDHTFMAKIGLDVVSAKNYRVTANLGLGVVFTRLAAYHVMYGNVEGGDQSAALIERDYRRSYQQTFAVMAGIEQEFRFAPRWALTLNVDFYHHSTMDYQFEDAPSKTGDSKTHYSVNLTPTSMVNATLGLRYYFTHGLIKKQEVQTVTQTSTAPISTTDKVVNN